MSATAGPSQGAAPEGRKRISFGIRKFLKGLAPVNNINTYNIGSVGNAIMAPNYGHVTQTTVEYQLLASLPAHPDVNGRLGDCFPGSRTDDVERILHWTETNHSELVLYVLGKVGVGKSTFAKYLASCLRQRNRLAGVLFFGFATPDWTPEFVIRIIASQLCKAHEQLTRSISHALLLDVDPSIPLEGRIQALILDPIRSLALPQPFVIILDALDQWDPHAIFIKALRVLAKDSHLVRVIILSRPGIEGRFKGVHTQQYEFLGVTKAVMANYFEDRFGEIEWEYGRRPEPQTISRLVDKAQGLFIWSSTLCSLLQDPLSCPLPNESIVSILRSGIGLGDSDVMAQLYYHALISRFPKPEHKAKLRTFLGAVLVLQEPLPIEGFAFLVSMDHQVVRTIQASLIPLQIGVPPKEDDRMVYPASTTFHLSLLEYLQSNAIPVESAFPVDIISAHSQLGRACLDEFPRLPHPLSSSTFISPLQNYAAKYWPIHTANGTPKVTLSSIIEWEATPHYSILKNFTPSQWCAWVEVYIHLILPGSKVEISYTSSQTGKDLALAFLGDIGSSGATDGQSSIALLEMAARLCPHHSPIWQRLAAALHREALRNISFGSITRAVQAAQCACELAGDSAEHKIMLGRSLATRYEYFGSKDDLRGAISNFREALSLCPQGQPNHSGALGCLTHSLRLLYSSAGAVGSLDEAVLCGREALSVLPREHSERPLFLSNLGIALCSQFELNGAAESLEEGIVHHQEALSLCPLGHPDRPRSLNNLGTALYLRFELNGATEDLEAVVAYHQEALSLCPQGNPGRPYSLHSLANALFSQFRVNGTLISLEQAISNHREALSLRPQGHPDRPSSLNNLALMLYSHFQLLGVPENLQEAIVFQREALLLSPPGHVDRPIFERALAELESVFNSLRKDVEPHNHHTSS